MEQLLALLATEAVSKLATPENLDIVLGWANKTIDELVRKGELTEEQAAARRQWMVDRMETDHWKPRA